ncbi:MAG: FAD-dependent oxidoreductase [Firmicutes bacterium]|nr:FAD-dependent oxidoreductase [Bacillota bacterium]
MPLGADNLLVAGRCISGSRVAMAAYRVTGICMPWDRWQGLQPTWPLKGELRRRRFLILSCGRGWLLRRWSWQGRKTLPKLLEK